MKDILKLNEIQLEEFKILKEVVKILEENGLRYSLIGGTLLGAVRHNGFIPWDDDIDIAMPRIDFERFFGIFIKSNKNKDLEIQSYKNGKSFFPFYKIVNKSIQIECEDICDQEERFLWIDVFPIDGLPDDENEVKKTYKKIDFLKKMLYIKKYRIFKDKYSSFEKKILKCIVKPVALLVNDNQIDKIARKYNFEDSKYVGVVVWGYGQKEKNRKEDMDSYIKWTFEGSEFCIIKGYDIYLRKLYGEYMKLPPKEKRVTHNIKAWRV